MYAIIELGGRQWKVEPGTRLSVNRLTGDVGAEHTVERVLFAHDGKTTQIGKPFIQGSKVVCEVLAHTLGPRVISYKYRRRENWRKTVGHRQALTQLVVKSISVSGMEPATAEALVKAAPPAPAVTKGGPGKPAAPKAPRAAKPKAEKPAAPAPATTKDGPGKAAVKRAAPKTAKPSKKTHG